MRRAGILPVLGAVLGLVVGLASTPSVVAAGASPPPTLHYIANLKGSTAPQSLGYSIFDTGRSQAAIDALPDGVQALVWIGEQCPTRADAAFKATIDTLAVDPKVYGYFLSDEPQVDKCPGGPAGLASRADYVRQASGGTQKSFITVFKDRNYRAFRPTVSHVDLFGIDPYPCSSRLGCVLSKIDDRVHAARVRGIPLRKMVPVFQAFGQSRATQYAWYALPTARQMTRILNRWHTLLPHPQLDFTYSWGHQKDANPTLVDAPALQRVLKAYFAR